VASDEIYAQAVAAAIEEADLLAPELKKLTDRAVALKKLIHAGSTLLGVDVPERFEWKIPESTAFRSTHISTHKTKRP
jgi:hypothetical protein